MLGDAGNSNRILVTLLNGANERSFAYDSAGNITGDDRGAAGNFTYSVSRTGRIVAANRNGVAQGTYSYDAFERLRTRTLTNQTPTTLNGTTHYVWDIFGNIIAEMNGATGAALRETVYLEGMPLSAVDAAASPKKIYAIHTDHLHRPVLMTDATKATVWAATYEPYGRVFSVSGTATQNLGLPGQWFQLETGLNYNWHRHYDPSLARYTTPDPLGFVDGPARQA